VNGNDGSPLGRRPATAPDSIPISDADNEEAAMRRLLCALGSLMVVAATPVLAGEVYVIETSQGDKPIAIKKDAGTLAAVPGMGEGKPNQGFSYGAIYELPGAGIRVMRGHVDPKGSIAVHEGPSQYILYVVSGTGKLSLNGRNGEQIGELTYKPDDVIVFQPHTLHGWTNGDTAFEFLGVDMPVLRK
jgi:quercetin dioxygenase-like cupin family protein